MIRCFGPDPEPLSLLIAECRTSCRIGSVGRSNGEHKQQIQIRKQLNVRDKSICRIKLSRN